MNWTYKEYEVQITAVHESLAVACPRSEMYEKGRLVREFDVGKVKTMSELGVAQEALLQDIASKALNAAEWRPKRAKRAPKEMAETSP